MSVPKERMGVYMGIFNGFIVSHRLSTISPIQYIYGPVLGNDPRNALVLCGVCLLLAAGSCFLVKETNLSEEDSLPS